MPSSASSSITSSGISSSLRCQRLGVLAMVVGEAAELVADHGEGLVGQARSPNSPSVDQRRKPPALRRRYCLRAMSSRGRARRPQRCRRVLDAEIGRAARSRPGSWRSRPPSGPDIRRRPAARISCSRSPKLPARRQPLGPVQHLAQCRCIGRIPGKAVGRELLALERRRIDGPPPTLRSRQRGARAFDQRLGGGQRLAGRAGRRRAEFDHARCLAAEAVPAQRSRTLVPPSG